MNSAMGKMPVTPKRLALVGFYSFFIAGALCNSLGMFRPVMIALTPLIMVSIGVAATVLTFRLSIRTVGAVVGVLILTFLCEAAGANFGFPFGDYAYTSLLGPKVLDVPIVIPFAWLAVLIPSWVAADRILRYKNVIVASVVVTAFDGVMEFAADSLDLWHWSGGLPTELNYISWFGISYLALSILKNYATEKESSSLVPHLLLAQLVYFFLSDVGMRFLFSHQ